MSVIPTSLRGGDRPVLLTLGAAALAAALGAVAVSSPAIAVGVALAIAVVVAVLLHPPLAAYLLIGLTPLIVGIERGAVLPVLRPSEALLVLVAGARALAWGTAVVATRTFRFRWRALDAVVVLLAVTGSVLPLLWLVARGQPITSDDVLYGLTLWRFYALFVVVRTCVRTPDELARCLWASLAAGAVVAVVGILQSLQLLGVPQLLTTYYAPLDNARALVINRGTSTLAHSHAVADLLVSNLAIAAAWLIQGARRRWLLAALGALCGLGVLASGTFSGLLALLVGAGAIGLVTGRVTKALLASVSGGVLAALLLRPVVSRRIASIDRSSGVPSSWLGRIQNLREFFLPDLTRDFGFLLGVRPAARVPAPESWGSGRRYVFIESGHVWLLWIGGIPFFAAFWAFVWVAVRAAHALATRGEGPARIAGIASFATLAVMVVLMSLDPHLTLRGAADLSFGLLGLVAAAHTWRVRP